MEGTLSVAIQATYPLGRADKALKALNTQHTQATSASPCPSPF